MKQFKPSDAYGMIGLTNEDLYPGPSWNFCFGWASFTEGVAAFSFKRYDPHFGEVFDVEGDKNLM